MQMNMNRREFLAAFGAVAAGAVLAGCGNSNATSTDSSSDAKSDEKKGMTLIEDGKLTVVAELGFAPFEYMDEKTGEPVGFDVDVINAVAEKMGRRLHRRHHHHRRAPRVRGLLRALP